MAGKGQGELAGIPGIRRPSRSKLEGQGDMQVATLKKIIESLGGEVDALPPDFPRPKCGSSNSICIGRLQRASVNCSFVKTANCCRHDESHETSRSAAGRVDIPLR